MLPKTGKQNNPPSLGWLWCLVAAASVLGMGAYYTYAQRAAREQTERSIAQERQKREASREAERREAERAEAAAAESRKKVDAESEEFRRVLEENTQRVLAGEKRFICQTCLGRGLTADVQGQRVCPSCRGRGETK